MPEQQVFISWSGDLSRQIAEAIHEWIPDVLRNFKPWMSREDLRKGLQWLPALNESLGTSSVGLLIITPDNFSAPWVLFEAGVIYRALQQQHCCPILFGLKPADITGPLVQFQATQFERDDMHKLVRTVNDSAKDGRTEQNRMDKWFSEYWPKLEERVAKLLKAAPKGGPQQKSEEKTRVEGMAEEILAGVQRLLRSDSSTRRTSFVPAGFGNGAFGLSARRRLPQIEQEIVEIMSGLGDAELQRLVRAARNRRRGFPLVSTIEPPSNSPTEARGSISAGPAGDNDVVDGLGP